MVSFFFTEANLLMRVSYVIFYQLFVVISRPLEHIFTLLFHFERF